MQHELKTAIKNKNDQFFSFVYTTSLFLQKWRTETIAEKAIYSCINGFCQSAMNYALSVEEDLATNISDYMPKAMMNRLLLRNCLEAYLILTILEEHPEYSEKYYATKDDDGERIEMLYSNIVNEKRYLKRFEWLPRFKGKRATSTKDLLKYIPFDDQEEIDFIETLIKNLDTFIHPSFHYAQTIHSPTAISDVSVIYSLYVDEGLIDELRRNIYQIIKESAIFPDFMKLSNHNGRIEDYIIEHKLRIPNVLPRSIIKLAQAIKQTNFSNYKGKGTVFLLQDLAPRYDDLLQSGFAGNSLLFFIQARYIIEALANINVLMDEDEKRNEIYHIHQNIKNFEAQQSSRTFLKIADDMSLENEKNIATIRNYYQEYFQATVDDNRINRLSGWALFLKKLNNTEPINSPDFVAMLGQDVYQDEANKRKLLVFYEESNAFTHITPYAFSKESKGHDLITILILVNDLLAYIVQKITISFDLKSKLDSTEIEAFESALYASIKAIASRGINYKNYA